jgi:beta-lactam-binding protein with PASTA domain
MPDLRGRGEDEVVNAIVAAGLKVGRISSQASAGELGSYSDRRVTRTVPAAGQRIYEGQSVNLEVTQ